MDFRIAKDLKVALKESERKTTPYDAEAEVLRVDGSTAWVKIPGGAPETPVQMSIDAKKGDRVNIRISGGRAWITGNNTAPPTDDSAAKDAVKQAIKAQRTASAITDNVMSSITEDTLHYLATTLSEGVTVDTPGWTEEPQEMDETNRYLWTYHTYTLANGNTVDSDPVLTGVYGDKGDPGDPGSTGPKGDTGKGISAVQPQYRLSTSPSYISGGSWSTTLTYTSGYYIWTREQITYDDGTVNYSTAIYDQALTTACSLSYDTAQYFWVNESGTTDVPTGAYVTETPQDTYKSNPTLGSILLRSAGIYIRHAKQTIAQFLSSGLTLFSAAGYKLAEFLSSGMTLYDGKGNTESNKTAEFNTNGVKLYAEGQEAANFSPNKFVVYGEVFGDTREIAHIGMGDDNPYEPYYTLGWRDDPIGGAGSFSVAEGYQTRAGGYAHSEGYYTKATGVGSHGEGGHPYGLGGAHFNSASGTCAHVQGAGSEATGEYSHAGGVATTAQGHCQTVIGQNNVAQGSAGSHVSTDHAFIIGNGIIDVQDNGAWDLGTPSNAMAVTWGGNVMISGTVQNMSGTTLLSSAGKAVSAGSADSATNDSAGHKISTYYSPTTHTHSGYASSTHTHGNLNNDGTISGTGITIGSGDRLMIYDSSNDGKMLSSTLTFGTATNTWLNNKGTWSTPTASQVGASASGTLTNLNSATESGIYNFSSSASNRPNSSYSAGMVVVSYNGTNSCYQIALQRESNNTLHLFGRCQVSGSWGEWKEFA